MADDYFYLGRPLSAFTLWELASIKKDMDDAEAKRSEAANHPKLVKRNIKLPPPNVEFLKLKDAVTAEITNRQKVNKNA